MAELLHFAVRPPQRKAGARVAEMGKAVLLKAAAEIELARQLIGQRLIVDKAVGVGRLDGLFVEAHGVERAAFDAGNLSAYQRGAVLEILRTVLRPCFELPVVSGQSLDMLLPPAGRGGSAGRGMGKCGVKVILRRLE